VLVQFEFETIRCCLFPNGVLLIDIRFLTA